MTVLTPDMIQPTKLPVVETVGATYDVLWNARDDLLRVAAIPVLLALGLRWGNREFNFVFCYMTFMLAVALSVLVTLAPVLFVMTAISAAEWLGSGGLALYAFGGPGEYIVEAVVVVLAVIAPIPVALRLALAFPAAAVDQADALERSWTCAYGSLSRMWTVLLLVMLPFYLGAYIVSYLLSQTDMFLTVPYADLLFSTIMTFLVLAAGSAALAELYRRLGPVTLARA